MYIFSRIPSFHCLDERETYLARYIVLLAFRDAARRTEHRRNDGRYSEDFLHKVEAIKFICGVDEFKEIRDCWCHIAIIHPNNIINLFKLFMKNSFKLEDLEVNPNE